MELYHTNLANSRAAGAKASELFPELSTSGVNLAGLPKLTYGTGMMLPGENGPVDVSGYGYDQSADEKAAQDAVYSRYARQLDPAQALETRTTDDKLRNMGLPIGSEAYNNEKDRIERSQASARQDALDASVGAGNALQNQVYGQRANEAQLRNSARAQSFGEEQYNDQSQWQKLAQLLAAANGTQIASAAPPSTAQMQISPADITGPTQSSYQSKSANAASNNAATTQALGTAAALAGSAAMMF